MGKKVEDNGLALQERKGKPLKHDPKFKGPVHKRSCTDIICCLFFIVFEAGMVLSDRVELPNYRSCTDIICCLFFIVFVGGLVVVGYFAFTFGNPSLLLYPMNSDKELCGFGTQKGKPNLLFFDLVACGKMGAGIFVDGCPTTQICVAECPTENWAYAQALNNANNLRYCRPGADLTKSVKELIAAEDCPAYLLDSEPVLHRCVPKALADLLNTVGSLKENIDNMENKTNLQDRNNQTLINQDNLYFTLLQFYTVLHRCVPKALADLLDTVGSLKENIDNMENKTNLQDRNNQTLTDQDLEDSFSAYGLFLKAKEYGEKVIQDVVASWWMILLGLLLAMAVSLIWIILMRWIAGVMVWLTILLFVGVFAFSSYWCFSNYMDAKGKEQSFHIHMAVLTFSFSKEKFWLAFGIISVAILAIVVLILLILCQRIRIAIALIKESSRAVGKMMFTLIFPVFTYALEIGIIAYWLTSSVYLASTGREPSFSLNNNDTSIRFDNGSYNYDVIKKEHVESVFDVIPCDNEVNGTLSEVCGVLKYAQEGRYTIYLQIYNLFMLFWMVNFVIALGEMTLAGAFASYYWAFNKPKDIPTYPLMSSIYRSFRYHLGSLAFGSLIIAIIQIIRVFLEYLDHKLKGSENPVAKFFMKCLKCCFWCLEKFIRFLNKNAYIMIAIHGKNFCSSAKSAFMLIMRNVVRVLVIDKTTDFLILIGKLLVVGGMACASYFFFNGDITFLNTYKPSLNFYVVPVVLVTLGSFVVASCFFSVYNMAVDTLFLCFLEDLERNDGSTEKPYFMPKNLLKILGKKNKKYTEDGDN